jgi:hypothetical protein
VCHARPLYHVSKSVILNGVMTYPMNNFDMLRGANSDSDRNGKEGRRYEHKTTHYNELATQYEC